MSSDQFTGDQPSAPRIEDALPVDDSFDDDLPAHLVCGAAGAPTDEDRLVGVVCHVGGVFTSFILPLALWLTKKKDSPFIAQHAREALNFQIFLIILYLLEMMAACGVAVVGFLVGITASMVAFWVICGGILVGAMGVYEITLVVLASVAAWRGQPYRCPCIVRVIR